MTAHADAAPTSPLADVLESFFETKTACDVEGTMSYFSPNLASYIDATLGWDFDSYDALKGVFNQYMPNWAPPARSYATRILANDTSALVHMTDTPELFGGELRILAADRLRRREDRPLGRLLGQLRVRRRALRPVPDPAGRVPEGPEGRRGRHAGGTRDGDRGHRTAAGLR